MWNHCKAEKFCSWYWEYLVVILTVFSKVISGKAEVVFSCAKEGPPGTETAKDTETVADADEDDDGVVEFDELKTLEEKVKKQGFNSRSLRKYWNQTNCYMELMRKLQRKQRKKRKNQLITYYLSCTII